MHAYVYAIRFVSPAVTVEVEAISSKLQFQRMSQRLSELSERVDALEQLQIQTLPGDAFQNAYCELIHAVWTDATLENKLKLTPADIEKYGFHTLLKGPITFSPLTNINLKDESTNTLYPNPFFNAKAFADVETLFKKATAAWTFYIPNSSIDAVSLAYIHDNFCPDLAK